MSLSPKEAYDLEVEIDHLLLVSRWLKGFETRLLKAWEDHDLEYAFDLIKVGSPWLNDDLELRVSGFQKRLLEALLARDASFFRMMADLCETRTGDWAHKKSSTEVAIFLAVQQRKRLEIDGRIVTRPEIRKAVELELAAIKSEHNFPDFPRSWFYSYLEHQLKGENGERLREKLTSKHFPNVWPRVWKAPELSDVPRGKLGRPRKK